MLGTPKDLHLTGQVIRVTHTLLNHTHVFNEKRPVLKQN